MSARTTVGSHQSADSSSRPVLRAGGATHPGHRRSVNEDAFYAGRRLCAVADGMGGHSAGHVASGLVVDWCADVDRAAVDDLPELERRLVALNASVRAAAADDLAGMGTTVVGVAIVPNGAAQSAVVFNVGDSRCYALRDTGLTQITVDHSHVQELIESGLLNESDAATHPMRHVVTRALGVEPDVAVDFHVLDDVDCRLVLCSDGVSGELESEEIARQARRANAPAVAAQRIVDRSLMGDAADNVTVVVVDVVFPSTVDPDDTRDRTVAIGAAAVDDDAVRPPPTRERDVTMRRASIAARRAER